MAKKRRRRNIKSKKALRPKLKTATMYSIVQIFFLSMAFLVLISFSENGLILIYLNRFLKSIFGWGSIFLPFIFISFSFLVSKYRFPLGSPNVIMGSLILAMSLITLTKSGLLGKSFWQGISSLLTVYGAFVVFLATAVIGIVIMLNTSLDSLIHFFTKFYKKHIFAGKPGAKKLIPSKKEMKVIGETAVESNARQDIAKSVVNKAPAGEVAFEQKLVTNIEGEDRIWKYPDISLLSDESSGKANRGVIKDNADTIEHTLESFGVTAQVVEVNMGPAVTQYALEVALGTKLSKITALEKDLARALASPTGTIRIEAPIPGRSLVGIEFPNITPEFVSIRKMIDSDAMKNKPSKLAVSLGLDVSGKAVIGDLGKMPHVLIAGQTGSGKSVCINTFLSTLLFRASPAEVKFLLVDPKRVELTGYNNIPHLLSPVIVDPKNVVSALRWLISEMTRRYKLFEQSGVKNIDGFNSMSGFQALPYIVLIIDELADIMLFSPVEVEDSITKIAQMSRATGIHMILATQRPSVDVITGLIKANIPCRIAFAVASQIDSRVILDGPGAEKLLGKGDMLYLPPDQAKPIRIQGAFISDKDTQNLMSFLKNQGVSPQFTEEITAMPTPGAMTVTGVEGELDEYFKDAVEIVCQYEKASSSLLQRRLKVGYARAARIIDELERAGVVGPADGSKPREVLIKSPEDIFRKEAANNG